MKRTRYSRKIKRKEGRPGGIQCTTQVKFKTLAQLRLGEALAPPPGSSFSPSGPTARNHGADHAGNHSHHHFVQRIPPLRHDHCQTERQRQPLQRNAFDKSCAVESMLERGWGASQKALSAAAKRRPTSIATSQKLVQYGCAEKTGRNCKHLATDRLAHRLATGPPKPRWQRTLHPQQCCARLDSCRASTRCRGQSVFDPEMFSRRPWSRVLRQDWYTPSNETCTRNRKLLECSERRSPSLNSSLGHTVRPSREVAPARPLSRLVPHRRC